MEYNKFHPLLHISEELLVLLLVVIVDLPLIN